MYFVKRYRLLIVIYGCALILGVRESSLKVNGSKNSGHSAPPPASVTLQIELFPDRAESLFLQGMSCMAKNDLHGARSSFERGIATGVKTNEELFYLYAVTLIATRADSSHIDAAVENWRRNFPRSPLRDPRAWHNSSVSASVP